MKVTVCELPNSWTKDDVYWNLLKDHLIKEKSDLLLLPEMPFFTWITRNKEVQPQLWEQAVMAHDIWVERLGELQVKTIISSRPIIEKKIRYNQGFIFTRNIGYIPVHNKYYLPDEPGYFEASWYEKGEKTFHIKRVNGINFGFLICTEIWFTARARDYMKQNIDILVCPRATPETKVDIWVTGGKAAAIVSGAFCLSSNYNGPNTETESFGGQGWIIEPDRGNVLGLTNESDLFLSLAIDLGAAKKAKKLYPRYVKD